MNRQEIEEILGYYAFNNREFTPEFQEYIEGLPQAEEIQRELAVIRILRRQLEALRRGHSQAQIGPEQTQIREALRLTNVDIQSAIDDILLLIRSEPTLHLEHAEETERYREVLGLNNQPITTEIEESIQNTVQQSYETLIKQLYGLPVVLPQFLILNGLKVNFISFEQLSSIQIERYIIEPLLQPWSGPPNTLNRILTIFGKNGITYLVKVRYDQATNHIYPPV